MTSGRRFVDALGQREVERRQPPGVVRGERDRDGAPTDVEVGVVVRRLGEKPDSHDERDRLGERRPLETLADLRLVKRIDAGDGIARYEPSRPDGDHHHHLVCRDCGKVEAFSDARLERAIDKVADGLGYSIEEHEVVLTGACAECAA